MEKLMNYQDYITSTPLIDRPVGEKRQSAIAPTLLIDRLSIKKVRGDRLSVKKASAIARKLKISQ